MFGFKVKKMVPESNNLIAVDALKVWSVTWKSHTNGDYMSDVDTHKEFFIDKQVAINFMDSINAARKLLKYRAGEPASIKEENQQ